MQSEAAVSSEFPSVISDDTSQTSAYQAALFHLRQGLQALCELSPGTDREKQEAHEEVLVLQRQILQLLHLHFSPERETSFFSEATGRPAFWASWVRARLWSRRSIPW